jgi:hypothetical protein
MKKKWQDPEYRTKTLTSIQKAAQNRTSTTTSTRRKAKPKKTRGEGIQKVKPITAGELAERKKKKEERAIARKKSSAVSRASLKSATTQQRTKPRGPSTSSTKSSSTSKYIPREVTTTEAKQQKKKKKTKKAKEKDGSVYRLREERRDLFEFLYGDDANILGGEDNDDYEDDVVGEVASKLGIYFGDEDLDKFDPYGLEDY